MANNDDSKSGYTSLKPSPIELNKASDNQPAPTAEAGGTGLHRYIEQYPIQLLVGVVIFVALFISFFVITPSTDSQPDPVNTSDTAKVPAQTPQARQSTTSQAGRYEETLAARREIRGRELVQDERISAVAELQLELEQNNVLLWAEERFNSAVELARLADTHYNQREWQAAAQNYQAAEQAFEAIRVSLPEVLTERVNAIVDDLEARRLPEAKVRIAELKNLNQNLPIISKLESKLELYPVLFDRLREAGALLDLGQIEEAAAKLAEAEAIDANYIDVLVLATRISATVLGQKFQLAMVNGLEAIASGRLKDAVVAFSKAVSLQPNDRAALEGLADADARFQRQRLEQLQAQATQAEQDEQWPEAALHYLAAQKIAGDIGAINKGLARSQKRLALDEKLAGLIATEDAFVTEERRSEGWEVLELTRKINPKGVRLQDQLAQIERSLRLAVKPIILTINSDNKTGIEIYKLGRFGTFKVRDFDLTPGEYTIRGTRRGYRDVLHIFKLKTSIPQKSLTVICTEKI